ncbi:MAG: response regulator transcription factor [Sulfurospirillaceae bacterium]|nr:response regulator transcription factor [Sulfurospirillaceae bacterium]
MQLEENLKKLSILCVEDDEGVRKRLANTLKYYFKEVIEADDGKEAYDIYQTQKIDIIITDIDMPKLNGISLVKKIRQQNTKIPIIVLSAYSNEEYLMELINSKIDNFILKPINSTKLLNALESINKDIFISQVEIPQGITINFDTLEIIYKDEKIKITNREKLFLELLTQNKNKVSKYEEIDEFVWRNDEMSHAALKTFIKSLRKKLPHNIIENVSGVGYRFCN